ncbi:MAG: biotin--[Clostridia bacterium]|nr:biotin--[acetyl-CoA-carboxylase] ligase [Clostridia bacterium]
MMISKERMEDLIQGVEIEVFPSIDSTNSEAKRRAMEGAALPLLVCAEEQSAGRGRLGRSFYSPSKSGLYMSLAFEAKGSMADAVTVTSAAAVAVAESIELLCARDCLIKWVNDIYVDGRKVCGILTEAVHGERIVIVVGIGINCTTQEFPSEIKDRAGSVGEVDRSCLAAAVAKKLLYYCDALSERKWIDEYRRRSLVLGEKINYTEGGEVKSALAVAIDENGGLVIRENGVERTLFTGEITVRVADSEF